MAARMVPKVQKAQKGAEPREFAMRGSGKRKRSGKRR
jgi:hypothetical protein